jgi:hemerythrin-like domain-containing protein
MNLIGYLMQEHRIIEKTLNMFELEIRRINEENCVDPISIDRSIDFIRTYTDLTHHGKEEDILFRELSKKQLLSEHARIMNELKEEHKYSRSIVGKWMGANNRYLDGEDTSREIVSYIEELTQFYPKHIVKEDEHFYYPAMGYFTAEENDRMIKEFVEFDKKILHWKYQKVAGLIKERLGE